MTKSEVAGNSESRYSEALASAARFPGVHINRAAYLRQALSRYCSDEQIRRAIDESPAAAGVTLSILDKTASDSIRFESAKVTALSAAAGLPGGVALIATAPADFVQTLGHVLRIAQKLAYLYSWPDLFSGNGNEPDDATKNVLTLFVGVMSGAQAANQGVTIVSELLAKQALRKLPQQALTKGVVYPIVKGVAGRLGADMTKQIFAKGVSKLIPVVGAVLSGGLSFATFVPMCRRLKNHLRSLELTKPQNERSGLGPQISPAVDTECKESERRFGIP